jgi:hypothetical protein
LLAEDETGATLIQGTLVIVRDVKVSGYPERPASIWARVAECDRQTESCTKAAVTTQ